MVVVSEATQRVHPVAADVLADLLLAAVEADRVPETNELLADLVGEMPVRAAHGVATDRLADAVAAAAGADPVDGDPDAAGARDVFDLASRLRATTPGGRP